MEPAPLTAARKAAMKRGAALDNHISASAGPFDAASLSRSYGVDLPEVVRILKSRGEYHG